MGDLVLLVRHQDSSMKVIEVKVAVVASFLALGVSILPSVHALVGVELSHLSISPFPTTLSESPMLRAQHGLWSLGSPGPSTLEVQLRRLPGFWGDLNHAEISLHSGRFVAGRVGVTLHPNPPPPSLESCGPLSALIYMTVSPEFRKRGYSELLLEVAAAIHAPYSTLLLATDNGSGKLVSLYESAGYEIVGAPEVETVDTVPMLRLNTVDMSDGWWSVAPCYFSPPQDPPSPLVLPS